MISLSLIIRLWHEGLRCKALACLCTVDLRIIEWHRSRPDYRISVVFRLPFRSLWKFRTSPLVSVSHTNDFGFGIMLFFSWWTDVLPLRVSSSHWVTKLSLPAEHINERSVCPFSFLFSINRSKWSLTIVPRSALLFEMQFVICNNSVSFIDRLVIRMGHSF